MKVQMQRKNSELDLISNVSKSLIENANPTEVLTAIKDIFNQAKIEGMNFVELKNVNIYIYDESTSTLKDFSKSWVEVEHSPNGHADDKSALINTPLKEFNFFINGKPYLLNDSTNYGEITINTDLNKVLFPLKKKDRLFGILEFVFPGEISEFINNEFFMMLSIVSYQISLKIQNNILAEQMQKNIDFHRSMKDIAKTIETQYELSYIMPIIGEMIDRFLSSHLIYVFLKDDEASDLKLVWPSACRDSSVGEIISKIKEGAKVTITNDGKVGVFPLVGKKLFGCIVAHSNTDKLSSKDVDYLEQLSKQSSITIQRANSYAEVLQHATLDALTGLNNRRQFEIRLKQEVATAGRQKKPLCAMMIDIDFFKTVNDKYGHIAGDNVLKNTANVIRQALREYDIASRYGGEEFVILLPFTKMEEAFAVAERLRVAVENSFIDVINEKDGTGVNVNVTISIGVYEYQEGDTPQLLYKKADEALYQAKTSGRNQVFIFK